MQISNAARRNIVPFSRAPPKRADIQCPAVGAHFLAHQNPEKYYYCLNGNGVILDCTPGLVYDSKMESCREPKYVNN